MIVVITALFALGLARPLLGEVSSNSVLKAQISLCELNLTATSDGYTIVQTAERSLQQTFAHITSFATRGTFESENYESVAGSLHFDLQKATDYIRMAEPCGGTLTKLANFVWRTHDVFSQAVIFLQFYKSDNLIHYLVRSVINLNLYLLTLHEFDGSPCSKLEHLQSTVFRLVQVLKLWNEMYQDVTDISVTESILFKTQRMRAEKTLLSMDRYISSKKADTPTKLHKSKVD